MSGKGKVSSDQNVQERRLRPVYDFLDAGNHKRVVQEADRLLKKQPDFQCAKALKALALLRMGHVADCKTIVDGLISGIPTEDNTIQALTICCRELGQPRLVCTILENASKVDKSEDLLSTCFMANVRVSDYQKQYQVALNLYKMHPKPPYFAWAVMSLFVKAELDSDPSSLRISLPLAEKMMGKFIEEENHVNSEHELSLYILILLRQENYKKILTVLDRLSAFETPDLTGFIYKVKSKCLEMTEDQEPFIEFLESKIVDNLDEWEYYDNYIKQCALVDERRTKDFLGSLEKYLPSLPSRSILLAPIFLYSHLVKHNVTELFDPTPYLRKYLFYYGSSSSFYADLETFFSSLISTELKLEVAQIIKEEVYDKREEFPQPNNIQAILNYCYVQRYLGTNLENDTRTIFEGYISHYLGTRGVEPTDGVKESLNEGGPRDFFFNLACLTILDKLWPACADWTWAESQHPHNKSEEPHLLSHKTGGGDVKVQVSSDPGLAPVLGKTEHGDGAIVPLTNGISLNQKPLGTNKRDVAPLLNLSLLQYCLDKSPRCSQARLLLAKSYIQCGACGPAVAVLAPLDIRHLMLTSTTYLYKWKLVSCGHYEEAMKTFITIETFYSNFEKEGMEHVLSAYKYGSWEKVLEFLKFRDHLLNSLQRQSVNVEKCLLEYCTEGPTSFFSHADSNLGKNARKVEITAEDVKKLDNLTDSRDFDIIDTFRFNPKRDEWKETSFAADKMKLRLRSMLLGLLNHSILMTDELGNQQPYQVELGKIEALLDLLQAELGSDTSKFTITDVTIDGMWPPEVSQYARGNCISYLVNLFKLTLEIGKNKTQVDYSGIYISLGACLEGVLGQGKLTKFMCEPSILDIGDILSSISEVVETMSISCVLLSLISFMTKTLPGVRDKSKKKKAKPVAEVNIVRDAQLLKLINLTAEGLKAVDVLLQALSGVTSNQFPTSWESMAAVWTTHVTQSLLDEILPSSLPFVVESLRSSYVKSTTSLSSLIQSKLTYLTNMSQSFYGTPVGGPGS